MNNLTQLPSPLLSEPSEEAAAASPDCVVWGLLYHPLEEEDNKSDNDDSGTNSERSANNNHMRQGTTASARFNLLSTMVGGGTLSLPYAFAKSGNALTGPLMLLIVAAVSECGLLLLVQAARRQHGPTHRLESLPQLVSAAWGHGAAALACQVLVAVFCGCTVVGYGVLLRDLLQPLSRALSHASCTDEDGCATTIDEDDDTVRAWILNVAHSENVLLWLVVLLVTPLCTLPTLTSLRRFGALSMACILVVGSCIVGCSVQRWKSSSLQDFDAFDWKQHFRLGPASWKDALDALPIYLYCYVCQFNVLTLHHEFRRPTDPRVQWWLRSTVWMATAFYAVVGLAGSTLHMEKRSSDDDDDATVPANILLALGDGTLSWVAHCGMAVTIAIALPMLVIPARDVLLQMCGGRMCPCSSPFASPQESDNDGASSMFLAEGELLWENGYMAMTNAAATDLPDPLSKQRREDCSAVTTTLSLNSVSSEEESRSELHHQDDDHHDDHQDDDSESFHHQEASESQQRAAGWPLRWTMAIVTLWSATAVASMVQSIHVVWELLGSTFAVSFIVLIPAGCFWSLASSWPRRDNIDARPDEGVQSNHRDPRDPTHDGVAVAPDPGNSNMQQIYRNRVLSQVLIAVFVPIMVLCSANSVHNLFVS